MRKTLKTGKDAEIQVFTPREILRGESSGRNYKKIAGRNKFPKSKIIIVKNKYTHSVGCLWREFRSKIIGGVIMASVIIGACALINMLNWRLGYEVLVDGKNIGLVTDKSVVYEAIDNVNIHMTEYLGEGSTYNKEPAFVRRIVPEEKISDVNSLKDSMLAGLDAMVEGYAVYVDGKVVFGVSSESAADWVFTKYKQRFMTDEITDDMVVDFCETTEVKKEFMHIGLLETPEDALAILSADSSEIGKYTVRANDTLWGIAKLHGTSVSEILALNGDISETIKEGMVIRVEKPTPLLSVKSIQTVSLEEPVPYQVEKIKDSSIYEGRTVVAQKGQNGNAKVMARITKVNGIQTEKEVLESETLVEPVKQIEKVGTKKRPPTTGSGTFIKPTMGSLSSRYGNRWGRKHTGMDFAGAYNSDIKAADGGIVTYAGWMSGYGNYVIINHENGYETAYGHCASLSVSVGSRVSKGDVIAKMGNTGRSTGTHLHFEVKKNGKYVDPSSYIGY